MSRLRAAAAAVLWLCLAAPAGAQGVLSGRVVFGGAPPEPSSIEVKSDVPVCGLHKETPKLVLGKDRGVAHAVVRVLGLKAAGPTSGTLDQIHCEFVPHVQTLPTGSTLTITSSDSVLHNAHGFNEDGSTAFNVAVPIPGMEITKKLAKPGVIKLRCDAGHTWMSAFIVVSDEPSAVTDTEGRFSIGGLPEGTYEVEVWQEWAGRTRQTVTVGGPENVDIILKENQAS